jgi:hypothetical protein
MSPKPTRERRDWRTRRDHRGTQKRASLTQFRSEVLNPLTEEDQKKQPERDFEAAAQLRKYCEQEDDQEG